MTFYNLEPKFDVQERNYRGMKVRVIAIFIPILLFFMGQTNDAGAQTDQLFWFVAPEINNYHGSGNVGEPTFLRISTSNLASHVTITQPAVPSFTPIEVDIPAGETRSIRFELGGGAGSYDLNAIENYLNPYELAGAGRVGNIGIKGLRIEASTPVTIYYEIGANKNREIMALKGQNALGTEFYVPFQTVYNNVNGYSKYREVYSAIDIVATKPSTTVEITPTVDMLIIGTSQTPWTAGNTYTVTLNAGETFCAVPYDATSENDFHLISRFDRLAGTKITSDKPIAVNTKDDLVWDNGSAVDFVADQLIPVELTGTEYVVMRGKLAANYEYAYVVGTDDNTDVYVDGVLEDNIDAGESLTIPITNTFTRISSADSSVYVYHVSGYNGTSGNQMGGAVLPTIEICTGSTEVAFTRSSPDPFFMNVLVRDGAQGAFELDGDASLIQASDFTEVIPGEWWAAVFQFSTAQVGVDQRNLLVNTEDVFHMGILNGNVDCFYGYFSDYKQLAVDALVAGTIEDLKILCYGDEAQLIAQGGNDFYWSADKSPEYISDPTSATPIVYPLEDRRYKVVVSGACDMVDSAFIDVFVSDPVEARFSADSVLGCSPFDVMLVNSSDENYSYKWADWDFGDGNTLRSSADTIYHTYLNPTANTVTYNTELVITNALRCRDTMSIDVTVFPEIIANFVPDTTACNPVSVPFRNNSSGDTDLYIWRFGDGATSDSENPSHTYINPSDENDTTYRVRLEAIAPNKFCRDTAYREVTVHPQLVAGFALNSDRACAPFTVAFANTSVGVDHYYWDLGDGNTPDMPTIPNDTLFHTYENTTANPIEYEIELRVTNAQGCEEIFLDTITVLPQVVADYSLNTNEGCNEAVVDFVNNPSAAASMHLWKFGDGTSSMSTDVQHTYVNDYGKDTTFRFFLASMSPHGCIDDTSGIITVYSARASFTVDNDEGCSPLPVTVQNNSTGSDLSYSWVYGDGYISADQTPAENPHIYNNTSGTPDNHVLSLDVTGNGGCADHAEFPITVYSEVTANFTMSAPDVCDSVEVTFTNTSSSFVNGHPATYLWDFGDGTTSSEAEPKHIFRNVTGSPVDLPIRLTVTTGNGCTDAFERTLRVHPYVKAEFSLDEVSGCSPYTAQVQTTVYPGITSYSWDFGAAGTDNVAEPGPKTYTLTTGGKQENVITLTVADASGSCSDQMSISTEVYSSVVSSFTTTPSEGCNPLDVTLESTSDGWAQDLSWDFGDGSSANATGAGNSQSHTYYNTAAADEVYTATLQVETEYGCSDASTKDITVYPFVLADFAIDKAQGCSPLEIGIDNRSYGGTYRIYWDDKNLSGAADMTMNNQGSFTHTYMNTSGSSQTHNLTLIADNGKGCYDTLRRKITVHSSIDAQFSMDVSEGCTPLEVAFDNTTQFANKYQWTFGDGTSSNMEDVSHSYNNLELSDQSYEVKLVAETPFGCVDSIKQTVDVWSYVQANFSVEDNEGCPPFDVVFENTSIGNASDTYAWSIDGSVSASAPTNKSNFAYQFDNTAVTVRDYQIELVASNVHGCSSTKEDRIQVYEHVTADFALSSTGECTPMEMYYEDLSLVPANTNYFWTFGDGATSGAQEPVHTFFNTSRTDDKAFTTKLKVTSAHYCSDSTTQSFTVYHQPKAQFDIDKTSSCPPLEVNLKNKSIGADQFTWRLGDGNERDNIDELSWSYDNTGNNVKDYQLELWNTTVHGCKDSSSLMLNVFPRVEAAFSYDTSGCSPFVSGFVNKSLNADYYYWDFADGNTSSQRDPVHRFSNTTDADKVYNVFMRASSEYNCVDEVTNQVTAYAQPIAEYSLEPIVQRFPENRVFITDASNAGPWNYDWSFGDDQTATGQVNYHDYVHWGNYDITLSLTSKTSQCADALTRSVTVLPPEIDARFSTDRVDGCAPLTVEFDAAPSVYDETYTYEWDFGDGTTGTGATPTHVYDHFGTFMVKLTAKGEGGSDYAYRKITAYEVPEAKFELAPRVSMLNDQLQARVEFYNLSSCGDTLGCNYNWDFGDGSSSTERDAVHNYNQLGKYNVTLVVTSSKGCRDEVTIENAVEVIGEGVIKFPNAFIPSEEGPSGGYYDTPDYKNQVFHPVTKGVIDYHLVVYNRWGEVVFETRDLEVGWDGYVDGKLAKQDVYVYKATGKFTNSEPFEKVGDVTLIR